MTKKYIYGPGIDNPIVMINVSGTTETWYYYFTDALGSVRFITDHTGDIQESYSYDPFGMPYGMVDAGADDNWLTEDTIRYLESPLGNPYMFTARRWDYGALLYYYRFRDYNPSLGRFCQPDPLHYIDGMNLYAYCNNNPLKWLDPWGLDKQDGTDPFIIGPVTALCGGFVICVAPTATVAWIGVGMVWGGGAFSIGQAFYYIGFPEGIGAAISSFIHLQGEAFDEMIDDVRNEYNYYENHPEDFLEDILYGRPPDL